MRKAAILLGSASSSGGAVASSDVKASFGLLFAPVSSSSASAHASSNLLFSALGTAIRNRTARLQEQKY